MDIQLVIVILIGIAVAAKLAHEIYKFFFVRNDSPYCGGCSMCDVPKKAQKQELS
ncbi:MAG: hypothetical protein PHO94_09305 [Petrimonas sp.]|nr:hypothetical protein [Petrimonas sp.]